MMETTPAGRALWNAATNKNKQTPEGRCLVCGSGLLNEALSEMIADQAPNLTTDTASLALVAGIPVGTYAPFYLSKRTMAPSVMTKGSSAVKVWSVPLQSGPC